MLVSVFSVLPLEAAVVFHYFGFSLQNTRNIAVQLYLLLVIQAILDLCLSARVTFQNLLTFLGYHPILDENFHELCNLRHLLCDIVLTVHFFACFRFSGITEEDMIGVHTSIYDVQATLLSFIHERTILIGHSLDSDFKALKVL
jgi:hypothetical protein